MITPSDPHHQNLPPKTLLTSHHYPKKEVGIAIILCSLFSATMGFRRMGLLESIDLLHKHRRQIQSPNVVYVIHEESNLYSF
jgi:hypothetical protein